MKRFRVLGFLVFLLMSASTSFAMDIAAYDKLARGAIQQILSGDIRDLNSLIADQERLMTLGLEGVREYRDKATNPAHIKIMELVLQNAQKMKTITIEEMEEAWHEGEVLKKNGIQFENIEHMGIAISLMDSVAHPASAYLLLKAYQKNPDTALLEQAVAELDEVLEHIQHIHIQ